MTDRRAGESSERGRGRLGHTQNQKAKTKNDNARESSEEGGATPAVLIYPALGTNVKAHGVATGIARAEWPYLTVAAFAHELAGAEQRLEMVGPLLV